MIASRKCLYTAIFRDHALNKGKATPMTRLSAENYTHAWAVVVAGKIQRKCAGFASNYAEAEKEARRIGARFTTRTILITTVLKMP
jgi:hypothetical protein